ncbi:MAG: hypothetical protein JW941_03510 [Candidatus Coatesbacteria bacterium]|nr:hypothetical protein [Candidatus Coatesbacteria bacterium]
MSDLLKCQNCGRVLDERLFDWTLHCPECGARLQVSLSARAASYLSRDVRFDFIREGVKLIPGAFAVLYVMSLLTLSLVISGALRRPLGLSTRPDTTYATPVILLCVGLIAVLIYARRYTKRVGAGLGLAKTATALSYIAIPLSLAIAAAGFFSQSTQMHDVRETIARNECQSINSALLLFHRDTGTWPIFTSVGHLPETRVDYLYGNRGDMPAFEDDVRASWGTRSEDMYFTLVTNGKSEPWYRHGRWLSEYEEDAFRDADQPIPSPGGWNGPYLPYGTDDPWGYRYLISVSGFDEGGTKPENHVWCLSSGVNGIVETPAWATQTHGDDIGYRTK